MKKKPKEPATKPACRQARRRGSFRFLRYLFIALILLWTFLPIYLMVKVSFSPAEEIMSQNPPLLIHSVTLDHWKDVFQSGNLWQPLAKSLTVASFVMILALLIAAGTSLALPIPIPTCPLPSPVTVKALKLRRLPPFITLATRLI